MLSALLLLAVSVICGTVAHELSHALALDAFDIPFDVDWFPREEDNGAPHLGIIGQWAAVSYDARDISVQTWKIRVSALMPLTLAAPLLMIPLGILPDPLAHGNLHASLALIGWLACAIPSPADFAIAWNPDRSIAMASGN